MKIPAMAVFVFATVLPLFGSAYTEETEGRAL